MPWAIAALAAVSAGLSAYSASEQADAQKKAANYQAQVDAENAKIALYNRSDALQRGELEAQKTMREQAQLIGTQRAALAASGVDVTQGSALDLLASTRFLSQEEVETIQSNAAREAWGYDVQASNFNNASDFERWKAKQANPVKAGVIAGTSSLLSSATSYYSAKASSSSAKPRA
ncbi:hypothetical protein NP590_05415 [Methylomonas sp. SURF-2]|uniref:Uncharacterized protein n=1 Tax=Methylomonas subterranea TaxID=2952225 RepID=A0ABT1TDK4_9GAMM|nr:hypothetical protein [Methylomonas sp. SURF-2]MCQ8103537.1 hypothetical protein [Methylomonas sp. SURF-2]